jgi:hypothetical protein
MEHLVQETAGWRVRAEEDCMKIAHTEMGTFQEILERRAAELVQLLRKRDGLAI